MLPTHLLLVRHGETDYNRNGVIQGSRDIPLNEQGRRQAEALAESLKQVKINAACSSGLSRAYETARIVVGSRPIKVTKFPELNEMSFGKYEGRSDEEVQRIFSQKHAAWARGELDIGFQDGENPSQVLQRADSRMRRIVHDHPGQTVLVVTHGRLMRILLFNWLSLEPSQMDDFAIPNTSVYHLSVVDGRAELLAVDQTGFRDKIYCNQYE